MRRWTKQVRVFQILSGGRSSFIGQAVEWTSYILESLVLIYIIKFRFLEITDNFLRRKIARVMTVS